MKKIQYLTAVGFLILIFGLGILNVKKTAPVIVENIRQNEEYFSEGGAVLEEDYRVSFLGKNEWINLYGLWQRMLGREIIGDMEFVKIENGLVDYVTKPADVSLFSKEMVTWKAMLDEKGIPLLYIQMPPREDKNDSDSEKLFKIRSYYEEIREVTDPAGIACLDETEILSGEEAPALEEFFFKTDIHTSTEGEVWMAGKIAEKLQELYKIEIPDVIQLQDERYEIRSHKFLGNLAYSTGALYNGTDTFTEYVPKEDTKFYISDLRGEWEDTGSFEEVLMNGYKESKQEGMYVYWVTNYLRYGSPAYRIENPNSDGPELLVVCDSYCYRTLSYLAMSCKSITVLDPRFYPKENNNYMEEALNMQTYDAAIYLHGVMYSTMFSMFGEWCLYQG